jgi:hypothetical protein
VYTHGVSNLFTVLGWTPPIHLEKDKFSVFERIAVLDNKDVWLEYYGLDFKNAYSY